MKKLYNLLKYFVLSSGLPIVIQHNDNTYDFLFGNYNNPHINLYFWDKISINRGEAGYYISNGYFAFGKIIPRDLDCAILIGPCADEICTPEHAANLLKEMNQPLQNISDLTAQLNTFKRCPTYEFIRHLTFLQFLINDNETVLNFSKKTPIKAKQYDADSPNYSNHANDNESFENRLLGLVEHGNPDEIMNIMDAPSPLFINTSMGETNLPSNRMYKNILIISMTLYSRAAIRGGLNYNNTLSLTDSYLNLIENVNNYSEFQFLEREMAITFAEKVRQLNLNNQITPLTRKVAMYVNGHLHDRVNVEIISQALGMNRSYISRKFKEDTGISLTDYIQKEKITEAKILILENKKSLSDISATLDFSSPAHFSRTFKKITGQTPGDFKSNTVS